MANWDKLNKQFDELIDNLSAEDWRIWAENRESRKAMRRLEMNMKAKLQEEKIYLSNREGVSFISNTSESTDFSQDNILNTSFVLACAGENNYALAA